MAHEKSLKICLLNELIQERIKNAGSAEGILVGGPSRCKGHLTLCCQQGEAEFIKPSGSQALQG